MRNIKNAGIKELFEWPQQEMDFHLMSQGHRGQRAGRKRVDCPARLSAAAKDSPKLQPLSMIPLKPNKKVLKKKLRKPFSGVLSSRRTSYQANRDFSFSELSNYLSYLMGNGKERDNGLDRRKKIYPSGGGLYESRIFLLIHRVKGVTPGLYFYDDEARRLYLLKQLRHVCFELLLFPVVATARQIKPPGPQVQLFILADLKRMRWAYEGIVYRTALCNATVLMTYGLLVAEAMDIGTVPLGQYPADFLSYELSLPETEFPLMTQYCLLGKIR